MPLKSNPKHWNIDTNSPEETRELGRNIIKLAYRGYLPTGGQLAPADH
jgi:hypothetical protein